MSLRILLLKLILNLIKKILSEWLNNGVIKLSIKQLRNLSEKLAKILNNEIIKLAFASENTTCKTCLQKPNLSNTKQQM